MTALRGPFAALAAAALLAGCAVGEPARDVELLRPEAVRARIVQLLPPRTPQAAGWAADIQAAFAALQLEPSDANLCAAIAVTEQESGMKADPEVAGLGRIARQEIERRAGALGIPAFVVGAALQIDSGDGRSYAERIAAARTEGELSRLYDSFVDRVPLGRRLLADHNPVRTGGPMQVRIAFAERHARERPYPYPVPGALRDEVFTRRGGMYFGIAHLLDYPADYPDLLYRYADYNAGRWASRNAAFQAAVARATGIRLDLDGDLVADDADAERAGPTEAAVRALLVPRGVAERTIRRALLRGDAADFADSDVVRRVWAIADEVAGRPLPRAVVPQIKLSGPKIQRSLTTEWFARRVQARWRQCLGRGDPG